MPFGLQFTSFIVGLIVGWFLLPMLLGSLGKMKSKSA